MPKIFGIEEQKDTFLPRMARGETRFLDDRATRRLRRAGDSHPRGVGQGDRYAIAGQKMWVTNGLRVAW